LLAFFAWLIFTFAAGTGRCRDAVAGMRAHNAIGGCIGLLLLGIVGLANGEFGMDDAGAQQLLHGLVAGQLLQLQGWM
jgi:hypothetical protein